MILHLLIFKLLIVYQTQTNLDLIAFINKINECSDKIAETKDLSEKCSILNSYNDECIQSMPYDDNYISFKILTCDFNIKRVPENMENFKTIQYFKNDPIGKNVLKVYLCFSQIYNDEIINWFITQKYTPYFYKYKGFHEETIKKMCADICQSLYFLHEKKEIKHNNIMQKSIVGVQQISKQNEELLQVQIQQMIYKLYDYNYKCGKEVFFCLPKRNYIPNTIKNCCKESYNTTVSTLSTYSYPLVKRASHLYHVVAQAKSFNFQPAKDILNISKWKNYVPNLFYPQKDMLYTFKIEILDINIEDHHQNELSIFVYNDKKWVRRIYKPIGGIMLLPEIYVDKISILISLFESDELEDVSLIDQNICFGVVDENFMKSEFSSDIRKYGEKIFSGTFKANELREVLNEQKIFFVITDLELAENFTTKRFYNNGKSLEKNYDLPENSQIAYSDYYIDICALGILAYRLGNRKFEKKVKKFRELTDQNIMTIASIVKYDHEGMSDDYFDFVKQCLNTEGASRISAKNLLKHPFLRLEINKME